MKSAIATVLCVAAFGIRTSGQTPRIYEIIDEGGTPPIPTVHSEIPNTLTTVVITSDYYAQPKVLVLHALNNSGKDISGYHITIRNKNPDGTLAQPDRRMTALDMLRTLVAPTALERRESERIFPIFTAGTTQDISLPGFDFGPDVAVTCDVLFYADGTFDETNEGAFKQMLAVRQRAYLAIKKAIEIAKNALAERTNDHPAAAAITELAKAAAEMMPYNLDGAYDTEHGQQYQLQWEMQTLHNTVQREQKDTTERERLAQYVEDQEKRIASMTPHCHLEIALKQ